MAHTKKKVRSELRKAHIALIKAKDLQARKEAQQEIRNFVKEMRYGY